MSCFQVLLSALFSNLPKIFQKHVSCFKSTWKHYFLYSLNWNNMKFKFNLSENSMTQIILCFQESSLMSLQSQCSWTKAWLIASTWCWLCCAVLIQVGYFYQIDRLSDSDCHESRWDNRECVSTGTVGARTRRSLGYHLLHLLILRPRVLIYKTDCTHRSKFLTHALLVKVDFGLWKWIWQQILLAK